MTAARRAGLLAIVLGIHGFIALPLPHSVREVDLKKPVATAELQRWSHWLRKVGVERTPDALRQDVLRVGQPLAAFRRAALKPLQPILRWTGTGQAWGFFNTPDAFPDQLRIEGRRNGNWELLFAALHPEHDTLGPQLRYRRVRGVYDANTDRPGASYKHLVDWIAAEVFEGDPDLMAVRVSFLRTHTTPPGRPTDDMAKKRLVRIRRRPS
jgi:hypothetical protein